jgi:hypothetical protein
MARVGFIEPMECLAADKLPDWLYKILRVDQYKISYVTREIMWRAGCCASQ